MNTWSWHAFQILECLVQKASSFGDISLCRGFCLSSSLSMELIDIEVLFQGLILDNIPRNVSTSFVLIDGFNI